MILRPGEIPPRGVRERADAVVVGSGAGGAVAAKTLAEAGLRVVVLEAGGAAAPHEAGPWNRDDLLGLYEGGGAPGTADAGVRVLRGRTLGGSTVLSDGVFASPSADVLAEWLSEGGLGFSADEVGRALGRAATLFKAAPTPPAAMNANNRLLLDGARAMGVQAGALVRAASGGPTEDDAPGAPIAEERRSALSVFVPMLEAFGAKIFLGARARRVRAVPGGVVVEGTMEGGKPVEVEARAAVLAAGALATPRILAASGVSAAGGNLHLSPAALVAGLFGSDVRAYEGAPAAAECRAWEASLGVVLRGHGPHPAWLAPCLGAASREAMERLPRLGVLEVALRDRSRGSVALDGAVRYALSAEDAARLAEGVQRAAELLLSSGAEKVYTPFESVGTVASKAEAARLRDEGARFAQLLATAPGGTCAPAQGVVGGTLEVEGLPGVYAMDASVLPTPAGVPPQAAILAIAECAAERLARLLNQGEAAG